jgi:hypothetical protein
MDEAALGSFRSFKHPLFSVLVPFSFVWLATWYLRAAFPALNAIPRVFPALLLIAALSETAVGNYLVSRKALGILPRMRELVVVTLFAYLFLKLVNGDLFRGDWSLARFDVVTAIVLTDVEWVLSIVIHSALRERELLLSLVVGKDRKMLKECFRDMGAEASNSLAGMTRVRRLLIVFQALAFVGLFVLGLAKPQAISPGIAVMALAHFAGGIIFFFTVTGYMERQALMGEGFTMSPRISSRRTTFAVALCLASCLVLIPLVGRDAPLPPSYLQSFLEWLQRIATLPDRQAAVKIDATRESAPKMKLDDQSRALSGLEGTGQNNEALQKFFRILILVLVAGGPAAAILILLVAPLFRRRQERLHPLRALRNWLAGAIRGLAQGVRNIAGALRRRPAHAGGRMSLRDILFGRTRSAEARVGEERVGFFQRLALSRELKAFVKVIRWGERRGVPFHRSLGPGEYAASLGSSVPAVRAELDTMATILEQILFSGRGVAPQRSEEYLEAARLVLRHR